MGSRVTFHFIFGLLWVGLIAGCGLSPDLVNISSDMVHGVKLAGINITPHNLTLSVGQEHIYTAEGTLSNGMLRDQSNKVTWSSSNTAVATVFKLDGQNILLAVAPGTATITALSDSISNTATLIVTASALKTLQINTARSTIEVGQRQPFTVTGSLVNGQTEELTRGVAWASSDPSVAIINDIGLATAISPGVITFSVTAGGIRNVITLTVSAQKRTESQMTEIRAPDNRTVVPSNNP